MEAIVAEDSSYYFVLWYEYEQYDRLFPIKLVDQEVSVNLSV